MELDVLDLSIESLRLGVLFYGFLIDAVDTYPNGRKDFGNRSIHPKQSSLFKEIEAGSWIGVSMYIP